ncbi:MAG: right-handed parallel beta-helix repeat-containing protein, partial [Nitratireductor sp.]
SPPVAGDAYALVGDQPIVRQSDFSPSNAFDTVKQNADLDYLTRTQQELARDLGRAPKVAFGRAGPALPVPAAGKLLRWDKDGANAIENADLESDLLNQAIQAAEEVTGTIPPLTFLSVASLRAFNNETVATAVDVIGWHSATRVGGGRFALDASDGATADDGGTVIVDAAGRRWKRRFPLPSTYEVAWFGARMNGADDDTDACQAAIAACGAAGGGTVWFGPGTHKYGGLTVPDDNVKLVHSRGATVVPVFDAQKLIYVTGDNCGVKGSVINGYAATLLVSSKHIIHAANCENFTAEKNRFKNITASDGNTGLTNLLAVHAIVIDNVDGATVKHNTVNGLSGATVFAFGSRDLDVLRNRIHNSVWYPICLYYDVAHFEIAWNRISSTDAMAIFWGGGINIMAQPPYPKPRHGHVHHNRLSGYYGYGVVLRVESTDDVLVEQNEIKNYEAASIATDATTLTGIAFQTRGTFASTLAENITDTQTGAVTINIAVTLNYPTQYFARVGSEWMLIAVDAADHQTPTTTINIVARGQNDTTPAGHSSGAVISDQNGPCRYATARHNRVHAPFSALTRMTGIAVLNEWQLARNPGDLIIIEDNFFLPAEGTASYLRHAIRVDGRKGGFTNVHINKNRGYTETNSSSQGLGAINVTAAAASGAVSGLWIDGNTMQDVGTPASSVQTALGLDYVEDVFMGRNVLSNFYRGLVVQANAGASIHTPYQQVFSNVDAARQYVMGGAGGTLPASDTQKYFSSTANLDDVSSIVNTVGKYQGKQVFNTSANKTVWASGATAGSSWVDAAGVAVNNPV